MGIGLYFLVDLWLRVRFWPRIFDIMNTAQDIALEHCAWAQQQGMEAYEVMASIGLITQDYCPGWAEAIDAIARRWMALGMDEAA